MSSPMVRLEWIKGSPREPAGKRVLVFFHGWCRFRRVWLPFLEHLARDPDLRDVDIVSCTYRTSPLSNVSTVEIVDAACSLLDAQKIGRYENITLSGFSLGGLLARMLWLTAHGRNRLSRVRSASPWASRIDHIVLMASPNRGSTMHDRSRWAAFLLALSELAHVGQQIRECVRGAAVVTNVRIDWILATDDTTMPLPFVTQVLTPGDLWVEPEESNDITLRRNGRQVVIGSGGHAGVLRFGGEHDQTYEVVKSAILGGHPEMDFLAGTSTDSRHLVMIRHGIRTAGAWVDRMSDTLREVQSIDARGMTPYQIDPSRYGWFTALRFLLPWTRNAQLRAFCDQYTEHMARNPRAQFHFIGHSFGTWIVGAALHACPSMRFHALALAGSVLHASYPWTERFNNGQVAALRSDCASRDLPVGVLCAALERTPLVARWLFPHLGTGGSEGFYESSDFIRSNRFLPGAHSAAVDSQRNLRSIAEWIVQWINGERKPPTPASPLVTRRSKICDLAQRVGWVIVPLVVIIIVAVAIIIALAARSAAESTGLDYFWAALTTIVLLSLLALALDLL